MGATTEKSVFPEKISPFLKEKMAALCAGGGAASADYRALYLQYVRQAAEDAVALEDNERHWEANVDVEMDGHRVKGVERLYRHSLVIEPTLVCASHCRYCLRAHYGMFTLSEDELKQAALFCGSKLVRDELREVLITGGDPLILPQRLGYLVDALMKYAPNVKTMRIATRLLSHDPRRIDNNIFEIFKHKPGIRFELATQINHPVELFPETIEKIVDISALGVKIYSQNVLLKGVNDDVETLAALYDRLRELHVEAHYLFHCLPMKGMHHLRPSLGKGIELVKRLLNSGRISGRIKPMFAAMTDIGKITLYEGTVLARKDNKVLLQSHYSYADRLRWNPNWKLPKTAAVDENGLLRMWYLDGSDDAASSREIPHA